MSEEEKKDISKEKIKLWANCMGGHPIGLVVICAPTGIICTTQAGGAICDQPGAEGYYMNVFLKESIWERNEIDVIFNKAYEELDDCGWGCNINMKGYEDSEIDAQRFNIAERKMLFAQEIDKFLKNDLIKYTWSSYDTFRFSFDYDRVGEVMEGWWPVLIQFQISVSIPIGENSPFFKTEDRWSDKEFKGYLSLGNCD